MPVESVISLNRKLPRARIFLDELKALEGIYCEAITLDAANVGVGFTYTVNDEFKCELDLLNVSTGFDSDKVNMSASWQVLNSYGEVATASSGVVLRISGSNEPTLEFPFWPGLTDNTKRGIVSKASELFRRRSDMWVRCWRPKLLLAATLADLAALAANSVYALSHTFPRWYYLSVVLPGVSVLPLLAINYLYAARSSVVVFRWRGDHLRSVREEGRKWSRDLLVAVIAAIIGGILGSILTSYLAKRH